jgi:leader peptidase (prepilin peptidase)/N-methyltransferase
VETYTLLIAALFGLLFGSFLNVVIIRIPKGESIVFGASHCVSCHTKLKPWHNIPLFSWILLRGKCAFCKEKIDWQYPLVELLSAFIFITIAYKYGLTINALFIALSFLMLLALSFIDLKYKMVPDSLNLLATLFAILAAGNIVGIMTNIEHAFLFAGGFTLLRFTLSYYLTSSVYRAGLKTKTTWNRHYDRAPMIEAMGEGDIMVAATMGALLGVELGLFAIFLSALLALPIMLLTLNKSQEEQRIPYVPFLTLATFLVFIFESEVHHFIGTLYL